MQCRNCHVTAPDGASACPSCGAPLAAAPSTPPAPPPVFAGSTNEPVAPPKASGLAIAGLVVAILGFCVPVLPSLVGLVLGIIALGQIGRSHGRIGGQAIAIAAIATSGVSLFASLFLGALMFPVFARARARAVATAPMAAPSHCMDNQKQLAIAYILASQDNNEKLPTGDPWQVLRVDATVLKCPDSPAPIGYGYNGAIAGKSMYDMYGGGIETIVVSADGFGDISRGAGADRTRHGSGLVAGFLDGHTEFVPAGATLNFTPKPLERAPGHGSSR